MIQQEVEKSVRVILIENLSLEDCEVTPTAHIIDDLGADSLDIAEMAIALEDKFKIEIPDSGLWKLKTVQDIIDYVSKGVVK